MSIIGYTFVTSLLQEVGWPRKQGLFRREAYNPTMVDLATVQMINWAASLGAGRPTIALQMIAEMFSDRNWDGDGAPQIAVVINGSREHWDKKPNAGPSEIVEPIPLANHCALISPKELQQASIRHALEQYVLEGCIWGLANRERFAKWYANNAERYASKLALYQRSGLAVETLPTLGALFDQSEHIVRDYEQRVAPLPNIPAKLLSDVRALGIEVK